MSRGEAVVVALLAVVVGCGGTTSIGSEKHIDVGTAGAGGTPGDASRPVGSGGLQIGGASFGSGGFGGSVCVCQTGECAPGTRRVQLPEQCCPTCEPCGPVNCPLIPSCGRGQQPIIAAGECCPTSCGPTGLGGAGGTGTAGAAGIGGNNSAGGTTGTGGFPACCSSDGDCGSDPTVHCVNTICLRPVPGGCWRDGDCPTGQRCEGPRICGCASDCSYSAIAGKCVVVTPGCCQKDFDCGDIVYVPCVNGMCKQTITGRCWTSAECGGGTCVGAFVCGCGLLCDQGDTPGTCAMHDAG